MADLFNSSSAVLSECGRYRYVLTRRWDWALPTLYYVMLNPSTATADADDPTVRKCVGFARRLGFGALEVRNLFAYRATCPDRLRSACDPVGPENDAHLAVLWPRAPVVAAWGDEGNRLIRARARAVRAAFREAGAELMCLGLTANGSPRHPLYVGYGRGLAPYSY